MEEEKVYLTMSAVGSPDEIVQALHELSTTLKTTSMHDMRKLSTYGNEVLICSKKIHTINTDVFQQKSIGKL